MNTQDTTIDKTQDKPGIDQSVTTAVAEADDDDWLSTTAPGYSPENPAGDICEACQ